MQQPITWRIAVVGGGASGFFAAIHLAERFSAAKVEILEKTGKFLTKVKVSGGGRCNVTHVHEIGSKFSGNYPRGGKEMRQLLQRFSALDTVHWFAAKNIDLHAEDDGRIFPASNTSQTIIDCFLSEVHRLGISLQPNTSVQTILKTGELFWLDNKGPYDKVVIAVGGHSKPTEYDKLHALGHSIALPVPSLFTFNIPSSPFNHLSGVSVPAVEIKIKGTRWSNIGPLLFTHWGLSGPAIIKLSAWAAIDLHQNNYDFTISISFLPGKKEDTLRAEMLAIQTKDAKKQVATHALFGLSSRLWSALVSQSSISEDERWHTLSHKKINKLIENLLRCTLDVKGKTTFKEEFVTCGGIQWEAVNLETLESKTCKGLYFCGEVLNVDGITGGFNFQAAWTTAYVVATGME